MADNHSKLGALLKSILSQNAAKGAEEVLKALDDTALEKAATALKTSEHVKDAWEEGEVHRNPSKEEIKTGPSFPAAGTGIEPMVREYSDPAPQKGIQLEAEKFMRALAPIMAASKAHTETLGFLMEAMKGMHTTLASLALKKASEDEGENEEDDEESEVVEINASKAKDLIGKARSLLKSARILTAKADEMEEEEEEEEAKGCRKAAKAKRKQAASLLSKARNHAYAAGSTELKKAIRDIAVKADIDVVQEEEEDEGEEEGEGKAKAQPAAKGQGNDKGNQADEVDPATGNQAAAAKADGQSLADALSGVKALDMKLNHMMDVIAGKSRIGSVMPDNIVKSSMDAIETLESRIVTAEATGTLSGEKLVLAKSISGMVRAAKAGRMDESIVKSRLQLAPADVRALFEIAA